MAALARRSQPDRVVTGTPHALPIWSARPSGTRRTFSSRSVAGAHRVFRVSGTSLSHHGFCREGAPGAADRRRFSRAVELLLGCTGCRSRKRTLGEALLGRRGETTPTAHRGDLAMHGVAATQCLLATSNQRYDEGGWPPRMDTSRKPGGNSERGFGGSSLSASSRPYSESTRRGPACPGQRFSMNRSEEANQLQTVRTRWP